VPACACASRASSSPRSREHVDVVGVARLPHRALDREITSDREARVVFAGSEAHPLFIIGRR
jgi:hypothetical protein